jgi:hypothetical protein
MCGQLFGIKAPTSPLLKTTESHLRVALAQMNKDSSVFYIFFPVIALPWQISLLINNPTHHQNNPFPK